jgi:hypothetical protein
MDFDRFLNRYINMEDAGTEAEDAAERMRMQ